jgi:hypothetical protein
MVEPQRCSRKSKGQRCRVQPGADVRIGPIRLPITRSRRVDQVSHLRFGEGQRAKIHREQLPPFFGRRALELFNDRGAPLERRIKNRHAVRTKDCDNAATVAAEVVDALDQCVNRDLILVVAVLLRARGR